MYYEDNRVKDLKVAYIGGGSRGWAWGFMMDLAADAQMEGTVALYDIDHEAAEHNEIIGNKISAHPDAVSHWKYTVADTLQQALTGADFVVISILPGTFDEMESDVHAPEAYGIYQSVGDTVGAGGFMRAMRTIPMYVTIAEAIRDYSPNAWVINYTNPMTLCVRTLYHVFPKIKAFGCCHEVFGTQKVLCAMLDEQEHIPGVKRQDLYTTVTGINHFTWITSASYQGMDLMPLYARFVEEHPEGIQLGSDNWMNSHFACAHKVKFDLFQRYGAIAAAVDRHLVEFLPQWYLHSPETAHQWKFDLTPVSWREDDLKKRMQRSDDLLSGKEPLDLTPSGAEGHLPLRENAGERIAKLAGKLAEAFDYERNSGSNGAIVRRKYGVSGAIEQAKAGFPLAIVAKSLHEEYNIESNGQGSVDSWAFALLGIMAELEDNNALKRGGNAGARFVKRRAAFLLSKRTMLTEAELLDFDDELIRRGISCGGAADMLAAAIFLSLADEEQRGFAELIKTTL